MPHRSPVGTLTIVDGGNEEQWPKLPAHLAGCSLSENSVSGRDVIFQQAKQEHVRQPAADFGTFGIGVADPVLHRDLLPVVHLRNATLPCVSDGLRPGILLQAGVAVAAFTPVLLLFAFVRFSFGYFVGFYFSSMFVGYFWLSFFSDYTYDHRTASLSAAASGRRFCSACPVHNVTDQAGRHGVAADIRSPPDADLPVLPGNRRGRCSYNFRIVSPGDVSNLRSDSFPTILNYLIAITSNSLLPFLFACFLTRKDLWRSAAVLVLLVFYYPIAMSKVSFFAPVWLVRLAILARIAGAKIAVILSLLIPALIGVILIFLFDKHSALSHVAISYFKIINFRMIAIPSVAMDFYNDFFSKHELTYFCQVWF